MFIKYVRLNMASKMSDQIQYGEQNGRRRPSNGVNIRYTHTIPNGLSDYKCCHSN